MNTRLVNTVADVINAALTQNRTAAGIAIALDSAQLLQSPEKAAELVALRNDALNMRGALSPNGFPRRVPMPLGKELAPVVDWLLNRVAELEAQRAALAARLRAGQEWKPDRNPPLVTQDYVSQDELRAIFGIPLVAPWDEAVMGGAE